MDEIIKKLTSIEQRLIEQNLLQKEIIPDSAIEKNHYFYALNPNA